MKIKDNKVFLTELEICTDEDLNYEIVRKLSNNEYTEEQCIAFVTRNCRLLEAIKKQTLAICTAAVNQDPNALIFAKIQTEEMCLPAVLRDPYCIRFIKDKTDAICMAAVMTNGLTLSCLPVKKRTYPICLIAVANDGRALDYVPKQDDTLCLLAVSRNFGMSLRHVQNQTPDIVTAALLAGAHHSSHHVKNWTTRLKEIATMVLNNNVFNKSSIEKSVDALLHIVKTNLPDNVNISDEDLIEIVE